MAKVHVKRYPGRGPERGKAVTIRTQVARTSEMVRQGGFGPFRACASVRGLKNGSVRTALHDRKGFLCRTGNNPREAIGRAVEALGRQLASERKGAFAGLGGPKSKGKVKRATPARSAKKPSRKVVTTSSRVVTTTLGHGGSKAPHCC